MNKRIEFKSRSKQIVAALTISLLLRPGISYAKDIEVNLNSNKLEFDVKPVIENGVTYVPMRTILESLGASVSWNGDTRTVTSVKDDSKVFIDIDNNIMYINDKIQDFNKVAILKNGRTLIPLRIISETFNSDVLYKEETNKKVIDINTRQARKVVKDGLVNQDKKLGLGMTEEDLISLMGQPSRKDVCFNEGNWFIYNNTSKTYKNYIQVRVLDGRVVELETNSKNWLIDNKHGVGQPYNKNDLYKLEMNYLNKGQILSFRETYDNKISFINLRLKDQTHNSISSPKIVSLLDEEKYIKTLENQMYDYVNVIRVNKGLPSLVRDESLNKLAREHSDEMSTKDYFSHNDFDGRAFKHRFNKLSFKRGGENIVAGALFSSEATNELYNSPGHRENILYDFNYLGIGFSFNEDSTYRGYFTQNFAGN